MRSTVGRAVGAIAAGVVLAGPVAAQTEVGVDMVLQVTNFSSSESFVDLENQTTFSFPAGHVRVGVFVTPEVSLEPRLGFTHTSSDGQSVSTTQLMVSGYYHFPRMGAARAAFLRGGIGASILGGSAVSDTQMLIEAGIGLKIPTRDRLLFRLEAFGGQAFESDISRAATRLGASFGVSWFSGGR